MVQQAAGANGSLTERTPEYQVLMVLMVLKVLKVL
jgi:hypothetical protein